MGTMQAGVRSRLQVSWRGQRSTLNFQLSTLGVGRSTFDVERSLPHT
jgi:hypothetical protein